MQCRKVLIIMDKYASGIVHRGRSPVESMIAETLSSTRLVGSIDVFYCDEMSKQGGVPMMGELLLKTCASNRPDLVVFWNVGHFGMNPERSTMRMITDVLGIKVYMVRGDSVGPDEDTFSRSWFPFVSFIGFWDATVAHLGYSQNPKAIQGLASFNPQYFYNRKLARDIDVSFPGSLAKPNRLEYIQFLRNHGVNVLTKKVNPDDPNIYNLSFEQYAAIISRSKITLNFCQWEAYSKFKGRVFDVTACKSLLVEDEGIETKEFFNEGRDFIMCKSKEDMLERVKYYLEHDEEREKVAESGYRKTTTLYNARNFWGYTFSKMGFEIPDDLARNRNFLKLYAKLDSFMDIDTKGRLCCSPKNIRGGLNAVP